MHQRIYAIATEGIQLQSKTKTRVYAKVVPRVYTIDSIQSFLRKSRRYMTYTSMYPPLNPYYGNCDISRQILGRVEEHKSSVFRIRAEILP